MSANRQELIDRCREKASRRSSPPVTELELEHGVPLFLGQLVEALCYEKTNPEALHNGILGSSGIASAESTRTAALHGKEQLREGYTLDQVVHGYGDVCQAITELAKERNEPVTVGEFHTFNRLLDSAIADAVSSYGDHRQSLSAQAAQDLHERLGSLADEQRAVLDTALKAFNALKVGNLGVRGATGASWKTACSNCVTSLISRFRRYAFRREMTTPPSP